jgi:hypothetical protein
MSLSEIEQHVFAHYVANAAQDLTMVPRAWPYGELVLIIEDKVQLATRPFGFKAAMACPNVARAFLDLMIERQGFSTLDNGFGGSMHRYQGEPYRNGLRDLQQTDPIIQQAQAEGAGFWEEAFARLSAS